MSNTRLTLCVAADERYRLGLEVTLFSALQNLSEPAQVLVVDSGLKDPASLLRRLAAHPRCAGGGFVIWSLETVASTYGAVDVTSEYLIQRGLAPWCKLFLPDLFPHIDRLVFLDSDTLVRADLAGMWATPRHGFAVSAVRDYLHPTLGPQLPGFDGSASDAALLPYFNTGVLMIDLVAWRELDLSKRALEYLARHLHDLWYADQDVLNAILLGRIHELDPLWNVQHAIVGSPLMNLGSEHGLTVTPRRLKREARIVHFTGTKPWQAEALRPSLWSVWVLLEYARVAWRYSDYSRREKLEAASAWLVALSRRGIEAVGKRRRRRSRACSQ